MSEEKKNTVIHNSNMEYLGFVLHFKYMNDDQMRCMKDRFVALQQTDLH